MDPVYPVIAILTIAMNAWNAMVDLRGTPSSATDPAASGTPYPWLLVVGAVKSAGALGVGIGLVAWLPAGIAAATVLVLLYGVVVVTRLRAKSLRGTGVPAVFLAVAAWCLTLSLR